MERLANKIANKISTELSYPEEQRQVIAYGLTALFQTILMTTIVLVLGAILRIFIESAILCFAVSILRKYSGGTHASSMASCTVIGVVFCICFGLMMKALSTLPISPLILISASVVTFAYAFSVAIKKAPVDSPNKPIRTEQKRNKMKKATVIVICTYVVISAILIFNFDRSEIFVGALYCLLLSVIWQMSSLTDPGRIVLERLDRLVYRLITFGRRT